MSALYMYLVLSINFSNHKGRRKGMACVTTAYVIITVYVISTACVIKNQLLM